MKTLAPEAPAADGKPVTIDSIVKHIREISTLPSTAIRVMQVAKDPRSGAADLKVLVESDPALCTRVLRNVNSAGNALRRKITNVHEAISYLGFNQIRNLALTASVSTIFKKDEKIGTYERRGLWRHLVSVGVCARLIARRRGFPSFEDAFMAGLLHDIGIILEDQHAHQQFRVMMQRLIETRSLVEQEQEHLGFDHTTLGSRIAEEWRFPPIARDAIRFHHMTENFRGEEKQILYCVELANVLCTLKGIPSVGMKLLRLPKAALAALRFNKDDVMVLAEDLDREIEANETLFEL